MEGAEGMMLFQHEAKKGQDINKCCMVSSAAWQLGHLEGSKMPLFLRFSAVKILPWRSVHMKNLIFGIASALFKSSHEPRQQWGIPCCSSSCNLLWWNSLFLKGPNNTRPLHLWWWVQYCADSYKESQRYLWDGGVWVGIPIKPRH